MTDPVATHYETHLGPVYRWMLGDVTAALAASDAELETLDLHADVIVCMGDTLTHLPTVSAVESLLADVASHLADSGLFAAA